MAVRKSFSKKYKNSRRYTPGRRTRVPYSRGQALPSYSRGKIVHVYPTAQSTFYTISASSTSPMSSTAGSGNCQPLNEIPLIGGMSGRTGYRVRMRTLLLNCEVKMADTGSVVPTYSHQHPKLWVLYDKRPSFPTGTHPSVTDVYEGDAFTSFRQLSSRDRFEVLFEKDIPLASNQIWNGTGLVYTLASQSFKRMSLRIPINRLTSWVSTDTSGHVDAMHIGALYLCFTSSNGYGTASPVCWFNWKLSFDDLMV